MDKELTEYFSLYANLENLYKKFLIRKQELRRLLEETAARKREAYQVLVRANRPIRHLTGRQRQQIGLTYHLGEIKTRINQVGQVFPRNARDGETLPEICLPEIREDCRGRELKKEGLLIIGLIDTVKKKLLHFDLLEQRCKELILSINKALEAFYHEWEIIRRKIYPFGVFSLLFRSFRGLLGKSYFVSRDLRDVAALGSITGLVLEIADARLI